MPKGNIVEHVLEMLTPSWMDENIMKPDKYEAYVIHILDMQLAYWLSNKESAPSGAINFNEGL